MNRYHRVSVGVVTAAALAACVAAAPAAGAPASTPHGPVAVAVPQRPGPPGVLVAEHPLMVKVRGYAAGGRPLYATGAPGGYTAGELRSYLRLRGTGAGQTVAIVDAYDNPYAAGDLNAYSAQFGLPHTCPAGQAAQPAGKCFGFRRLHPFGIGGIDPGWALEESLDMEMVHAIAPQASIDLVEARNDDVTSLFRAISYAAALHAVVISNSWGFSGEVKGETGYDHYCQLTAAVCVFATGDSGHPGGYPAYNPSVIAAGGTTLSLTRSGTVTAETAWNASGGGVSKYEPRPSYQSAAINPYPNRGIPDVSFDANPSTGVAVYSTVNGGWFEVGGTSVSAPAWSAILADADQLRAAAGTGPLTAAGYQAQRALYGLAEGLADITKGSNGGCGKVCQAGPGYDFVTGLGSPRPGIDTALAAGPPQAAPVGPALTMRGGAGARPDTGGGEPGGYGPTELRSYLKLRGTGAGQTVAIAVAYNVSQSVRSALSGYDGWYGLPRPCSATVTTGCFHLSFANPYDATASSNLFVEIDWLGYTDLEVELIHALAPKASIDVVEAHDESLASLLRAVRYAQHGHPAAISEPWGTAEFAGEQTDDSACPANGAICVAPSGDCGHYPQKSCQQGVLGGYPAADPGVLCVGGTTLGLAPSGHVTSQTAWDGSGGGISKYEPQPGYQRAADPHKSGRGIPDVSFAADPGAGVSGYYHVIFTYKGKVTKLAPGWDEWGGTSVGAQAWAAIIASADQLRAAAGRSPLTIGELQAAVYAKGAKPIADITAGANGLCALCYAGPGYDLVTGEGSPRPGIDSYLAGQ